MYKLPPLYKPIENTPVPECVYKMKKISDHFNNGNTVEQADVAQIGDADMADLDRRWTEITSRLEKLQADITAYKATSETSTTPLTLPTLEFQDLVITANPSRPPHSLPLIKQQLEKLGMHVYATTHVHSTAYQEVISDDLRHFIQSETNLERRQAQIALTLIWRKEKDDEPSLMVSPSTQAAAIKGEANIARYLIRSVPRLLNYESDPLRAVRIDELLDLTDVSAPLGASPSKKERPAALQLIEKLLADSQALDGGNELTALDFVVYSAVVNSQLTDKELGPNIKAWMQRCKPAVN